MSMFNPDTELFFPMRAIPALGSVRGCEWQGLIESVLQPGASENDLAAISLMVVRLCGCVNCNVDSFRAMRGCTECARLTLRRHKGSDFDLLQLYESTRIEVSEFLDKRERSS